jgi:hypothetical protein
MTLKTLRFERRINNHSLPPNSDGLGKCRSPPLRLVRSTHLSRRFGQHIQSVKILARRKRNLARFPFILSCRIRVLILITIRKVGKFVESQQDALSVPQRDRGAFLYQMIGEAIDAAFGKLLAACLARMLVAITGILKLLASNEELEDELVGFATHVEIAWQNR